MHPSDEIRGMKSSLLKGKRIILAVTGSIAAVETVRLARELIRHGADVIRRQIIRCFGLVQCNQQVSSGLI